MTRDDILQPPGTLEAEGEVFIAPPAWAQDRALEYCGGALEMPNPAFTAFARYIEQHEQPPVDPDVLAVREILVAWNEKQELTVRIGGGSFDEDARFIDALETYRTIKANGGVVK